MTELANSNYALSAVRQALAEYGISAESHALEQVVKYCELLELWSGRVNLTAVRARDQILRRHFAESMLGAQLIDNKRHSLVDVGSGAGFPGLPLKLLRPELQVTLLEPNLKKAAFLGEVVRVLGLEGVLIKRQRLEEYSTLGSAECDVVTARAVGGFDSLLACAHRALVDGGQLLLWLGAGDADKVRQSEGWRWSKPISIPGSSRTLILPSHRA